MKTHARNERINQSCFSLKLLFLFFLITACGGIVPGPTPKVEKTSPKDGDTDVELNKSITVTFSKEMAPETLTSTTFLLKQKGGPPITGDVSLNSQKATFKLQNDLAGDTTFEAIVTTGVKDLTGKPLLSVHKWEFTSGPPGTVDKIPPTVDSKDPDNADIEVPIDKVIKITFSEEIDPNTFPPILDTFSVSGGTKGKLSFDGNVVTFDPNDVPNGKTPGLRPLREITVTILGAGLDANREVQKDCIQCVKDLAGNALESDVIWTFLTAAKPPKPPDPNAPID